MPCFVKPLPFWAIHGLLPISILIGAILLASQVGPVTIVAGGAGSLNDCHFPAAMPDSFSAETKALAAFSIDLSEAVRVSTSTPETDPPPTAFHTSRFQPAALNKVLSELVSWIISGVSPKVKILIRLPLNALSLSRIASRCALFSDLGASCASIFTRARCSSSAFWFASAARCSALAARSWVLAISRLRCSSLILPIQTTRTVATAVNIKPMMRPTFAASYNHAAVPGDGHIRRQ